MAVVFALVGLLGVLALGTVTISTIPVFQPNVASAQSVCPQPLNLANGSFESPEIPNLGSPTPAGWQHWNRGANGRSYTMPAALTNWSTTDATGVVEIFETFAGSTFSAVDGDQWAELNASQGAQLYQDLDTSTLVGQTLSWSFSHMGRLGADTMGLYIGTPGSEAQIMTATDARGVWGQYSGTYTVPAGQTLTRFAFRAISSANGNSSYGNFLDAISIGIPSCNPSLTIDKTSDFAPLDPLVEGDEITYSFEVENTGTVPLTNVTVTDPLPGLSAITPGPVAELAVGDSLTFTATYTVTLADVDAGQITNIATATADMPEGCVDCLQPTDTDTEVVPPTQQPDVAVEKTSDVEDDQVLTIGDIVTYTFVAENTGNVTLTDVTITDTLPGISAIEPVSVASLIPDATATFTATYVVTQSDVDSGVIVNSATATGTPPPSCTGCTLPVSSPDSVTIIIPPATPTPTETATIVATATETMEATATVTTVPGAVPSLGIVKTADTAGPVSAGDVITYIFTVTNTGNTPVDNVTVADPLPGLSTIDGPHGITLAPGESAEFTAEYAVTEADANAGTIANSAMVTGTDVAGTSVSAEDSINLVACSIPGAPEVTPTPGEGSPVPLVEVEAGSHVDAAADCPVPAPTEEPSNPEPTRPSGGGPVVLLPSTGQPNGSGSGFSPILPIAALILLGLAITVSLIQRHRQTGR